MLRRAFVFGTLSIIASPLLAQDAQWERRSGVRVFGNDGVFVGETRSTMLLSRGRLRLIVRRRAGSLFRRVDEDVIIDVPLNKVTESASGIILPASKQELRNRLRYYPRVNDPGRITLR